MVKLMETKGKLRTKKLLWSLLLFLDVLLFVEALSTNNIWACLVVMIVSEIIYFKGNKYLFGEFDAKRRKKREIRKQEILKQRALEASK
ncbi:hypothetical protein ACFQAV_12700 [Companilactobacillus huachuanensis]|uniref:Uncharacterized protein n=1 Tax=Companilactobacillus huachuanensis TaxID=2559914 RepID=A0ABW1RQH8_9LACO|nr:hypothetical protein [Companilactobacillus huachuanensis]